MEKLTDLKGLCNLLGVTEKTLYTWVSDDRYKIKECMFKVGQSWRIDEEGYKQLIQNIKAA